MWIKHYIIYVDWILKPETIPEEMMRGDTFLIYKGGDQTDSKNFRPITCLNVIIKVFTKILKNKIEKAMKESQQERQISLNQLGGRKNTYASKEGLIRNILLQTYLNKKSEKWIEIYYDVTKAYC